jgi:hypothetical protein
LSWFKIDDGFDTHPKTLAAGNEAAGLWVRCGAYCSRHLTEGRVPRAVALMYGDMHLIDTLVKVGLFEPIEDDWLIHDFHDFNPSKEKVLGDREAAAKRQRDAREKARLAREAKAAKDAAAANRHADSHAVTSGVTNADSHTESDVESEERHAVTHAAAARGDVITVTIDPAPQEASDITAVQNIDDAPSRRDSRQQSRAPRPDPTRPVLPTEVREDQTTLSSGALFEIEMPPPEEPAGKPRASNAPSAQTFIAEWLDSCASDDQPTTNIIKRVGKELKQLIAENARAEDIRAGLAEWDAKGDSPTSLASFVNGARRRRRQAEQGSGIPGQRLSPVDQRFAAAIAAGERLEAQARANAQPPPSLADPHLAQVIQFPQKEIAS